MITPAYSPTATERVLPRLALDFTTGVLDPRVTVTRALNTATRFNSSGLIEIVNAGLPRFDYNPATLAPRGLLIEETRANALINSVLAKGASLPTSWIQSVGGGVQDVVASIYGNLDGAYAWQQTATNERPFFVPSTGMSVSANTSYFLSMYLEENPNGISVQNMLTYNSLPSGTATYYVNGVSVAGGSVPTAPCRLGVLLAIGATGGTIFPRIGLGGQAAVTGTIKFSRPQWEAGAFATSYIPTTTTSLTRNADQVTMTGTNFSSWFNASEGTLSFEGSIFVDQGATTVDFIQMSNGVSNSISIDLAMFGANAPVFQVSNSGTQCSIDTGTLTLNTVFKMVGAYKENAFVAAMNGQSPGVDNSGTIPSGLVQMGIGNRLSGPLMNGHARKIAYWPQRLINAETQAFSKG